MKQKKWDYLFVLVGVILLFGGLFLLKSSSNPQGMMRILPYICIGIGCGTFGYGMGNIASKRIYRKAPHMQKQLEIDQKDERNVAIGNRAKARAFDFMLYIFSALMITFALMEVELAVILLLVFAYLIVVGSFVFYLIKYEKEM